MIMLSKIDPKLKDAIDLASNWLEYQCYIKRVPGVSFGIIKDDKLVYSNNYGYSDVENNKLASNNTAYRIASISKIFTSVAILQLVEKKLLNLDDLVSKHLEWFKSDSDINLKDISIRHLLFHCSGLIRESDENYWNNDKFPTVEEIKKFISQKPSVYPVLKTWKYSNLGYGILGLVIEKVSGKKYEDYVKENIIKKLNLTHTEPDLTKDSINYLATGYSRDVPNEKRSPFQHVKTNGLISATGFLSNVEDLSKLLIALFNDNNNSILSLVSRKEMMRIQWEKDQTVKWSLGFQITKLKDTTIYGHHGGFPGFITSVGYSPNSALGIVILTNCIDGPSALWLQSMFNILITAMNNYDSYSSNKKINLERYVGRYGSREGCFDVRKINNTLLMFNSPYLDPFYEVYVLEYKKDDTFFIKSGNGVGNIGEDVRFIFKGKKIEKVIVGFDESTPEVIKR